MRIGAYNQISAVYGAQPVKQSYNSGKVEAAVSRDQISFSTVGKDMQTAKTALNSVPDVREDRVNALRERIANGTYDVSAQNFADKLVAAFETKAI